MTFELNEEQRLAAECLDRPVLVTAGAGSGKTRMLTQRFVNAVVPGAVPGWEPAEVDQVVAITFTDKAAGEIAERVGLALNAAGRCDDARRVSDAWISTIHGLCSRLLRRHAFDAGVDPLFAVLDTVQAGDLREAAFDDAARTLLADDDATELFDCYRYDLLSSACIDVTRKLAVLGSTPDGIELESADSVERLLGDAQRLFERGTTSCDLGYAGTSAQPADHAVLCHELLGMCSQLVVPGRAEENVLDELLLALQSYKPLSKALKGMSDLATELRATLDDLKGRTAAAAVARHARAFKRLVGAYASAYATRKAQLGMLDFDDLQTKAVELLEGHPDLANAYRARFRAVMIDEFQDTDALQLRLVEALSDNDLCTVGDEMQSIYHFRGADIEVYRDHRSRMERGGALPASLYINYRSHPELLAFVNAVFRSTEYFGTDLLELVPGPGAGEGRALDRVLGESPRVEALFVDSSEVEGDTACAAEAALITRRLGELLEDGAKPGDIAVLVRTYGHAHVYADALSCAGIRAVVVGGSRFFDLSETAVMRALNRVIANPEDGQALGMLLVSDFMPLSSDALAVLRLGSGERDRRTLWALLKDASQLLEGEDQDAASRLFSLLSRAQARGGSMPLADVLMLAVEESGWDLRLLSGGNVGREAFANVLKFLRQASEFEVSDGTGPAGFTLHLEAKERHGDTESPASLADGGSEAVRIMSIHSSKGLEFPIVVVPDLTSGGRNDAPIVRTGHHGGLLALAIKTSSDPLGDSRPDSTWFSAFKEHEAEEDASAAKRLLYVAFTRARDALLISGSMSLRTKNPTQAKHNLASLTRVLSIRTPVSGSSDDVAVVPGGTARYRLRIVDAAEVELVHEEAASHTNESLLPPAPGPVNVEQAEPFVPERLSYTQLNEFEHCPKAFWIRRVIGVSTAATRAPGEDDPKRFGTALHAALRLVTPQGDPPQDDRIESIGTYMQLGSAEIARLADAVGRYCASDVARRASAGDIVRRESPFAVPIGDRFLLTGSIDLYSRIGDSSFVLDYKSGQRGASDELEDRYRLQAECYALAVLLNGCARVAVEFVRPEVAQADGTLERTAFEFDTADAARIESDLIGRYDEIVTSAFDARPSRDCAHCDVPRGLCPEN